MALIKSYYTNLGITANYWRLYQLKLDRFYHTCEILMALYADENARRMNVNPIQLQSFIIEGITGDEEMNPLVVAYNQLKNLPDFKGAIDG